MLRWLNVVVIFLTFLAYLAPYVPPATFWPIALLGLLYPVLLLINIIFVLFWLLLRKRYFLLSLGCILLGWTQLTSFVGFNRSVKANTYPGEEISVITYNCRLLRKVEDNRRRVDKDSFTALINQLSPDILCMQEFSMAERWAGEYTAHLQANTPLKYVYRESGRGLAVFSRFPIGKKNTKYFSNGANGFSFTDLKIGEKQIRVYNVHLQTNALSVIADQVAQDGQFQDKETWLNIKGMLGRYRRSAQQRAGQAQEVALNIARSPYPTIVCGDFNDVPFSYAYHQVAHGMKDGFKVRGSGLGTTFQGNIPALRIDYILHDPAFKVLEYRVVKEGHSDHYPVLERLVLVDR